MRAYRFIVPTHDNRGAELTREHDAFKNWLVDVYGGYSAYVGHGAWRGAAGELYCEAHVAYEVGGADPDTTIAQLRELFVDQKCFAYLKTGELNFVDNADELTPLD